MIRGIAEIVLNTRDQQAALAFYRDLLGLSFMAQAGEPGPIFLQAGPTNVAIPQMIVLVPLPPDSPAFGRPRPLHHLAFEVDPAEFDALEARLRDHGLAIRGGQHPVIPSRTIYVDDPDGNEVEIISARLG
jgi:catechol 2,3-dioxygenase-like lactoylglutathione lyase family enzyme